MVLRLKMMLIFSMLVLVTGLCACGGGGGGGGTVGVTPSTTNSTNKGNYQGPWQSSDQNGMANITVDAVGQLSGSLINKSTSHTANITSGAINNDGNIYFTYKYPEDTVQGTVSGKATTSGNTITINATNSISNKVLTLFSQLINNDTIVNVSNNADYWEGSFNIGNKKVTLNQTGQILSGTYKYPDSMSTSEFNVGTVSGTIIGSVIKLVFNDYYGKTETINGLVSTGFYYPTTKINYTTNYAGNSTNGVATPGGKCIIEYDFSYTSNYFIRDYLELKAN